MKPVIATMLFFTIGIHNCSAQDSAVLISTSMFEVGERIPLGQQGGWLFREGNETSWAAVDLDLSGWQKLKPTELTSKYADKTGKVEGWFRFRFKLDSSFKNLSLGIKKGGWAATDIYIDGNFFKSFGNTGAYGGVYEEYNPIDKLSQSLDLDQHTEHLIALHFVDYTSAFPPWQLKSNTSGGTRKETTTPSYFLILTGPKHNTWLMNDSKATLKARTTWLSVTALLAGLFWLLAFQNLQERKNLLLIAICASFSALSNVCRFYFTDPEASFLTFRISWLLYNLSVWLFEVMVFLIVARILRFKFSKMLNLFLISVSFLGSLLIFFDFADRFVYSVPIVIFLISLYMLSSSWKKLRGAQWAILVGLLLTVLWGCVLVLQTFNISLGYRGFFVVSGLYFSFPISLLIYLSLRFREIIREVREHARLVVQMTEEKKEQAVRQQKVLEEEVARQTSELRSTLDNLKSTQAQLVHSEKMASLGELTAGIAHEIQNPLNFVNNFAEVNTELINELEQEAGKGNLDEVKAIAKDIKENEEKINHHGKRADAIVKGMLQHSRTSTGQKEPTDINALCDEYLRLSYHGLRAKDKTFNAKCETDFDSSIGKISIVPQDIGRVLLNLINNAFYAVDEKNKALQPRPTDSSGRAPKGGVEYEPTVSVSTRKLNGTVEIKVCDNGNGIPRKVLDKIFQPFFTTKPTGQGTGLGLSLSYDIIKAHGGELKVETREGEGSEFIIQLSVT